MASSILCALLVALTVVVIGSTARGDDGANALAGFTLVPMTESRFIVEWPYNVPLDARYEFAGGVRRMWVYSTDKPFSRTLPGAARTETKINVRLRERHAKLQSSPLSPRPPTLLN
jgi:hypothetical protein